MLREQKYLGERGDWLYGSQSGKASWRSQHSEIDVKNKWEFAAGLKWLEKEEVVERMMVRACESEGWVTLAPSGVEAGSKPNAILRSSCSICVCLGQVGILGAVGLVACLAGLGSLATGKLTSFLPTPLLSTSHKVVLKWHQEQLLKQFCQLMGLWN